MAREPQILACSGVIYPPAEFPPQWRGAQIWQAMQLAGVGQPRMLDEILRECWDAGVVLAGQSAGSPCWHLGGITDSFGDSLDPVTDCFGVPALQ